MLYTTTRREGHTGHNHTIKPCIGCSSEWRNKDIQLAQIEQKSDSYTLFIPGWPPLFGRPSFQLTFYSWMAALIWSAFFPTDFLFLDGCPYLVGLLSNWFYSTFYSWMAALIWSAFFILTQLFDGRPYIGCPYFYSTWMAALIWSHLFYFTDWFLFLIPCLITTDWFLFYFIIFFFGKKRCLTLDSNPGPLDLQSVCLPLDHHHTP